jgi:transketolase
VGIAVGCCEKLRQLDKKVDVYNINTVKPLDRDGLIRFIAGARKIVTIEDHSVIGGIGSAVLEAIGDEGRRPVLRIGIKDVFPESGKPEHLYEKYGLSEAKIIDRMLSWM